MGGGTKLPVKASPQKGKNKAVTRKRVASKAIVDDEASESDDGVLVDRRSDPAGPADIESYQEDLDVYEEDFINDGDPFADQTEPSDEEFPAALLPIKKKPASKSARSSNTTPVIDIASSSEEDLAAMDVDDSMYKKPAGVKPTALPPSLGTRSATAKRAASSQSGQTSESPKKARTVQKQAELSKSTTGMHIPEGGFGSQADAMTFMAQFMSVICPSRELSIPRIDFDELELQKGLKASRAERSKPFPGGASSSKVNESSPPWDPPYDGDSPEVVSKRKGKATESGRFKNVQNPKSSRVAPDPITRMERGEDMQEAPIPDTKDVVVPSAQHLTLEQYFAKYGTVAATAESIAQSVERPEVDEEDHPTVFMEDLETYKRYYDPLALCGVNDEDLQDPVLVNTYIGQPPLPDNKYILPVYDPARLTGQESEPIKGGRVKFSTWARHIRPILADNAIGALVFREAAPNFINLSRVSPTRLSSQVSAGSTATQRLNVDNRVAVCVTSLFCTESYLETPQKIGPNSEWERMESVLCLTLGEPVLYAQLTPMNALSFQTMMSPANSTAIQESMDAFANAPADMFTPVTPSKSPAKAKSPSKPWNFTSKTLLACHDKVPVYDARKIVIDFTTDLGRLDKILPAFNGEVPCGSFVVVGYTVSSYKASLSAGGERVPHLGCNILWAIVCGVPVLKVKPKP
ncbi:hypothetical protein B0H13DRAFT_2358667 [Mycena leptocephala]|nr:hypothetical protein B0H13DRAFT_2358667 [Mycena leptocephala]